SVGVSARQIPKILPLSEALDDLYKEFNALKERLGDLTEKFTGIESFIDEVKSSRATNIGPATGPAPAPAPGPASGPIQRQGGRRVLRKKTTTST
ncbi:hypothetical protein XENORESO_013066, partial [Xenotaenia resolanae]